MRYVFEVPSTDQPIYRVAAIAPDAQAAKAHFSDLLGWPVPDPREAIEGEKIDLDLSE